MQEPLYLTDEMFDEVIEKASAAQIEILFIRMYGILQTTEKQGEKIAAEFAAEAIQFMLDRIRAKEESQCES